VAGATPVLLHTEVMREHVLVERRDGVWEPRGLLDFEPARVGAAEYDLASVGVFLAAGEPGLLRAFLSGYGLAGERLTAGLQERILLHTLLHRYGNLRWYLERLPPRRAATLPELAREWFAFE
jgi:hygromycin-B 7''-O-kinase